MQIWMLIALFLGCMGIFTVISGASSLSWLRADNTSGIPVDYARWAQAIYTLLLFGLPAIIYANVFPMERFRWFRLYVPVKPAALVFAILSLVLFTPVVGWIASLLQEMITDQGYKDYVKESNANENWVMSMPSMRDLLLLLFSSAFIPAVCEELFFRGCLQQVFGQFFGQFPQAGIWATAVIFALVHIDPAAMVPIFFAGLILGYAFYWTGSLRTTILMHFAFNSVSIVLTYIDQHSAAAAAWDFPGWLVGVCAALTFVCFGLLKRFSPEPLG